MSLIEHLEKHLGSIAQGWKLTQGSTRIQVAAFRDRPHRGACTYVTVGLSHHNLKRRDGKRACEELVFSAYERFSGVKISSFLITFCEFILKHHKAVWPGDIIGPDNPLIPGIRLNSIYVAFPTMFSESFGVLRDTNPSIYFPWLVPLHASEADFFRREGENGFEDMLEARDPDMLDLDRGPLI